MGAITAELVEVGEQRGARGRRVMPAKAERRVETITYERATGPKAARSVPADTLETIELVP